MRGRVIGSRPVRLPDGTTGTTPMGVEEGWEEVLKVIIMIGEWPISRF